MCGRFLSAIIGGLVAVAVTLLGLFLFRNEISSFLVQTELVREIESVTVVREIEDVIPLVIESANDAVVSVVATKDMPIYEQYFEEYNPFGFWGSFQVPRVRERGTEEREIGGGSGFIVSADGHVVTNRHVVSDDDARYSVVFADGQTRNVSVLAKDPILDVAILQIETTDSEALPFLKFSNYDVRLGETVIVIGNALAEFRNSVSVGVVSGLSRSITARGSSGRSEQLREVIQTDAAINPGNSGGPMLNLKGEVIGVSVATTVGADNISFALPAMMVSDIVRSVQETGRIVRPYLGIRYTMVTERLQEVNTLSVDYGALIVRGETREELAVIPGSPADKAGLRENDIILSIDGKSLKATDVATELRLKSVGDNLTLRVWRAGEEIDVSVTLEPLPE